MLLEQRWLVKMKEFAVVAQFDLAAVRCAGDPSSRW
jgi:hypothetical protein